MINKYHKYLRIVTIDVLVYSMSKINRLQQPNGEFDIQNETLTKQKKKYFIVQNGVSVHSSILFKKLNILKLIKKKDQL